MTPTPPPPGAPAGGADGLLFCAYLRDGAVTFHVREGDWLALLTPRQRAELTTGLADVTARAARLHTNEDHPHDR